MEKVQINGQKVFFDSLSGAGQAVLLLHGWGHDSSTWGSTSESLANFGFKVFTLDLPGFGQSSKPPDSWGVPEYAELVEGFILSLRVPHPRNLGEGRSNLVTNANYGIAASAMPPRNDSKVVIIGHSFGGRIGIYLAAHHPEIVEKLILVNSAGTRSKIHKLGILIGGTKKLLKKLHLRSLEQVGRKVVYKILHASDYLESKEMEFIFQNIIAYDQSWEMENINSPTFIIHGENDQVVPVSNARKMNQLIKGSQLEIVKDAGHFVHQEKPELFLGLVRKFIKLT